MRLQSLFAVLFFGISAKKEDVSVVRKTSNGKYIFRYGDNYDPMTSRFVPLEPNRGPSFPYLITESRLKNIRQHFMYPFYDRGNIHNNGDYLKSIRYNHSYVYKKLNFPLPFFGFVRNYVKVSLDGFLGFDHNYYSSNFTSTDFPLIFPTKKGLKNNDPAFIGIFYSKCTIGKMKRKDVDRRKPGVYFRVENHLRTRTDRMGVEIRERIKWDIREGIIGSQNFNPKHAIIVTWKNVSFAGGMHSALFKTNTFQLVLATDEVYTYAIFNYDNIDWTSHTEAGGDVYFGMGGTPAFVGFNAGYGRGVYYYEPYSQHVEITSLTLNGFGNEMKGRHYFRVDEMIVAGSCNKNSIYPYVDTIIAPDSGNMLGGTMVNISGLCFKLTDQVECNFGTVKVLGIVLNTNRAMCVQPQLFEEGYIDLQIRVVGRGRWHNKYYVETPARASPRIYFNDKSYTLKTPSQIGITWNVQNLSTNEHYFVRISLWGYRETPQPELLYITDLATNIENTGWYKIKPSLYKNHTNKLLMDLKFGFIQINTTDPIPVAHQQKIIPVIWSNPIPLGWYFNWQWQSEYGENWPSYFCNEWIKNDSRLKNFTSDLPPCPCTLEQALANKGMFMPDTDCDKDSNPYCYLHRSAVHCVKSGNPTPEGAEQQCCYDRNHYLMLSQDQQWGSYPRRSHEFGHVPWHEPTKIPTFSQWHNDIIPRFMCCFWQTETADNCETLRVQKRPSQHCVNYQAPEVAGVYGDPHIITFDNLPYTFNGKGEFVLVKSEGAKDHLEIQGRFEQMSKTIKATVLTSVVAKGNTNTIIEIRTRPTKARWRYHLDVLANGRKIYFDKPSMKFQHFPGVTVYTPTYILNQSEVVVMFDSGAGLEVVEDYGYMTARVYLPRTFFNKTRGLLGNWSFDILDDFTLPNGKVVSSDLNDMRQIYNQFGLKWMVTDVPKRYKGTSLFHRKFGRTAANYNSKKFRPEFKTKINDLMPENTTLLQAYQFCSSTNQYECLFDYAVTHNKEMALTTTSHKESIMKLKEVNHKKIISCGVLNTPRFGRKSTFLFTPGTVVRFECYENFILEGDYKRECLPSGEWDRSHYGYTKCLGSQEYSHASMTPSGFIILIILASVLFGIYKKFGNTRNKKEMQKETDTIITNLIKEG